MILPEAVHDPERLRALARYDGIDAGPEADFDEIAGLAARLCKMPVSLVSLVSPDRQVFKAAVGLDMRGTPILQSICAHALDGRDVLEISDTRSDPRTKDNEIVTGPTQIRFYAGAPLRTEDGQVIGTLCVLDFEPRRLDDLQRESLRVLANQVVRQFDLRRMVLESRVLRDEVDHRVRNSLQSVVALTRLQARGVAARTDTRRALDIVVGRLQTVAALHDALLRGKNAGQIDLAAYLATITDLLDGVRPAAVSLVCRMAPVEMDARRASAVATLVNEFVQNAFFHAFPNGRAGRVDIVGEPCGADSYRLILSDDGIGFPTGQGQGDPQAGGLGLAVIEACAAQIAAVLDRPETERGLTLRVTFPLAIGVAAG